MGLEITGSENKNVHLCLDSKICGYMPYDKNRDINCWNISYINLRFGFCLCKY